MDYFLWYICGHSDGGDDPKDWFPRESKVKLDGSICLLIVGCPKAAGELTLDFII